MSSKRTPYLGDDPEELRRQLAAWGLDPDDRTHLTLFEWNLLHPEAPRYFTSVCNFSFVLFKKPAPGPIWRPNNPPRRKRPR